MRSDRALRVMVPALTLVSVSCLYALLAAASLTPDPYSSTTVTTPTNYPIHTPNATEITEGYLSVTAYPDTGSAPLSVVIVASYIGPYGLGPCGLGP